VSVLEEDLPSRFSRSLALGTSLRVSPVQEVSLTAWAEELALKTGKLTELVCASDASGAFLGR
jgi:hypothetical protein